MVNDRLVAVGEIGRAYGLRGEVRVMPLTDDPSRFSRRDTYVLWDPRNGGRQPCRITASRRQGDAVLVTVDGYESPEAAKQRAGRLLAVPETAHGNVARGVAREMEPTDATDGDDTAGSEQASRLTDGDVAVA